MKKLLFAALTALTVASSPHMHVHAAEAVKSAAANPVLKNLDLAKRIGSFLPSKDLAALSSSLTTKDKNGNPVNILKETVDAIASKLTKNNLPLAGLSDATKQFIAQHIVRNSVQPAGNGTDATPELINAYLADAIATQQPENITNDLRTLLGQLIRNYQLPFYNTALEARRLLDSHRNNLDNALQAAGEDQLLRTAVSKVHTFNWRPRAEQVMDEIRLDLNNLAAEKAQQSIDLVLAMYPSLKKLILEKCPIAHPRVVSPSLTRLDAEKNSNLTSLAGLTAPMLQTLSVINTRLTSVAGNFPSLTRLNADYNSNLTSLAGLSAPMLQKLSVIDTRLTSLAGNFASLTELYADENMNLTSLEGLVAPQLQRLGVSECGLTNLAGNFPSLTDLYAVRNGEPTSLNGLVAPNIREVNLKKYHSFDAYLHPWKRAAKTAAKAVVGLSVAAFCTYNRDTIRGAISGADSKLDQLVKQLGTFLRNLVRN